MIFASYNRLTLWNGEGTPPDNPPDNPPDDPPPEPTGGSGSTGFGSGGTGIADYLVAVVFTSEKEYLFSNGIFTDGHVFL